eukprot:59740-Rhodomonas_salina.1
MPLTAPSAATSSLASGTLANGSHPLLRSGRLARTLFYAATLTVPSRGKNFTTTSPQRWQLIS